MPAKCVRILGISASYAPGARQGPITLVFSAHDEVHNDAVVLWDLLLGRSVKRKPKAGSPAA